MRRRAELALLSAVIAAIGVWAFHDRLRPVAWAVRGALELIALPDVPASAPSAPPTHVAHAGGALRGMHYTNALDALEQNYALGARWFEIDLLRTADGTFWAVHDWREAHERLGLPLDGRGFGLPRQQPPGALFRVPPIEEALAWFAAHPEARLITDTKEDNAALLRRLASEPPGLRARIHPQIYRIGEYAQARAGGFGAPIFTTYRSHYPWWILRRFVRGHPLLAVTVTRGEAHDACEALCGNVPLLTHTVNDPSEAAALVRAGIAGIYTDELLP